MDPTETLNRIAFLLERENESSYRVESFRKAAGKLASVDSAELRRLDGADQLQSLEGIGKTTATVISEALSGKTPKYLTDLEGHSSLPILRAAFRSSTPLRRR